MTELAVALIAAESVNPALGAGGSGEGAAAEAVAAWARDEGLEVEIDEVLPGRPNVVVTAPGVGEGPALMLNGHLDTVSAGGMERPFEGRVAGERNPAAQGDGDPAARHLRAREGGVRAAVRAQQSPGVGIHPRGRDLPAPGGRTGMSRRLDGGSRKTASWHLARVSTEAPACPAPEQPAVRP